MNVIPLLQTKATDTAHMGILASVPDPFFNFQVGPGDEARVAEASLVQQQRQYSTHILSSVSPSVVIEHKWP